MRPRSFVATDVGVLVLTSVGRSVVGGTADGELTAWDVDTAQSQWSTAIGQMRELAVSASGHLVVAAYDGLSIVDPETGAFEQVPDSPERPACIAAAGERTFWIGEFSGMLHRLEIDGSGNPTMTSFFTDASIETLVWTDAGLLTSGTQEDVRLYASSSLENPEPGMLFPTAQNSWHIQEGYGPPQVLISVSRGGWAVGGWSGELAMFTDVGDHEPVELHPQMGDTIVGLVEVQGSLFAADAHGTVRQTSSDDPASLSEVPAGFRATSLCRLSDESIAVGGEDGIAIVDLDQTAQ